MSEIHVLVVDDEKEIADLVEIYLVSDGYKVYKASNALEGLEILENRLFYLLDGTFSDLISQAPNSG